MQTTTSEHRTGMATAQDGVLGGFTHHLEQQSAGVAEPVPIGIFNSSKEPS
jgi:hypothetical protein